MKPCLFEIDCSIVVGLQPIGFIAIDLDHIKHILFSLHVFQSFLIMLRKSDIMRCQCACHLLSASSLIEKSVAWLSCNNTIKGVSGKVFDALKYRNC
jgi:hypothetical protein